MKSAVADPQYKIHCLRIVPQWGATVYLTDHPRDLVMNGHTYQTDSGYQFSGHASEANMSPGVMDLDGVAGIAGISRSEIVSGVFDNARVYAFATTWTNPTEDEEPLGVAIMGKTTLKDKRYTAELMMLVDALNQTVGDTHVGKCNKRFGGQEYAGCMVDLAPLTVTGTITSVLDNGEFRDDTLTDLNDYFGEGLISFNTGANAGLKPMEIKAYRGVYSALITAITRASSAVVTVGAHDFIIGDRIDFSGVFGMTQINGQTGTVTAIGATTITVNINSSIYGIYSSGGTAALQHGTVVTHEPFHYAVSVGDVYTLIPGCRQRLEDCRDKWANVPNFGGDPFIPSPSIYMKVGGT